jgi:hypothetical protein
MTSSLYMLNKNECSAPAKLYPASFRFIAKWNSLSFSIMLKLKLSFSIFNFLPYTVTVDGTGSEVLQIFSFEYFPGAL